MWWLFVTKNLPGRPVLSAGVKDIKDPHLGCGSFHLSEGCSHRVDESGKSYILIAAH